ncbi:AdoMet_MTases domain containing protein [Comamonadaceae bacterium]
MINANALALLPVLRCPECKSGPLTQQNQRLVCPTCALSFEVTAKGVPILLSGRGKQHQTEQLTSDTGQAMVHEYQNYAAPDRAADAPSAAAKPWWHWLRPPSVHYDPNGDMRQVHTTRLFNHQGSDTLVLSVGGGPTRHRPNEITLNIEAFVNVDVVGDAHDIPLHDNSVDTVICNAVLEHVRDPYKVASELMRVLKPGGMLYVEMPFLFFFHGYPNDYTRFTREGLRRVFRTMDIQHIGISGGPMSSLLQTANMVWLLLIPERWSKVRKLFSGVFRWMFFPFKYLDKWLQNLPQAHTVAAGFYLLARKPGDRT